MNNLLYLGKEICKNYRINKDLKSCYQILDSYNGYDWLMYKKKPKNTYEKHQVYIDEYIDIYIIVWNIGAISEIHDHPENGCLMRLLEGKLKENIYDVNKSTINNKIYNNNDISFIKGKNGIHSIENINNDYSYSIHIYSPPNYEHKIYLI